jgi:hypothetical protein
MVDRILRCIRLEMYRRNPGLDPAAVEKILAAARAEAARGAPHPDLVALGQAQVEQAAWEETARAAGISVQDGILG